MKKTNAMRILDRNKIKYNAITYQVDEKDLSAIHVADSLGQDIAKVFKTLVLEGDKTGYIVACIPGAEEVDLKKLAAVSGNKKCVMIPMKSILNITGYIRGGCSPVGMKKPFPTFVHFSATDFETIYISAGVRGMQVEINPSHLIDLTQATVGDLV
ncbi:Cys-tRNA(Pro) deacylase [Plebeiibacterium sediminum]|uniref:Cys-tRNA(Pro)/Cys-tRNA(Cys) deacylase n=1 Tax=Plebeiibacterium sediminum TaxID=2992112 RepID=A0AAE3M1R0_9BACT|nr:Cys-tRNA(Pro) deacylase [Plebeiobacterium sediminum]MCW3785331.1 Cys-tRNA(Pro) deacylase [Plebeiobacterium sediminum]